MESPLRREYLWYSAREYRNADKTLWEGARMLYIVLYFLAGIAWSLYLHKRYKNPWRRTLAFIIVFLTWPFAVYTWMFYKTFDKGL
jgi:hypothetical protein